VAGFREQARDNRAAEAGADAANSRHIGDSLR